MIPLSVSLQWHITWLLQSLKVLSIIASFVTGFIPVGLRWIHYDYCEAVCAIDWSSEGADKFVIVAFVTCFITPALTMVVCYTIIFRVSVSKVCYYYSPSPQDILAPWQKLAWELHVFSEFDGYIFIIAKIFSGLAWASKSPQATVFCMPSFVSRRYMKW